MITEPIKPTVWEFKVVDCDMNSWTVPAHYYEMAGNYAMFYLNNMLVGSIRKPRNVAVLRSVPREELETSKIRRP